MADKLSQRLDSETPEMDELRKINAKLQKQLTVAKAKTESLIEAVQLAAYEAAVTVGRPKVPTVKKSGKRKNAEVALIHATDWQCGKRTESYDSDVLERRMQLFAEKIARITENQRADHPVDECVVMFGGDQVEGVSIFPGQAFEVDSTLYDQLFKAAAISEQLIVNLLSVFPKVRVVTEYGNHGRLGRRGDMPSHDNMDLVLYHIVKDRTESERVEWQISTHWHQIVEVGNYKALLVHGDEIKSFGGNCVTPDVRVLTRDLRWVPAGELEVGDKLLAFTEHGDPVRHYCDAEVTATGIHERDVWKITFEDGSFVRCTPEHPWIVSQTDRDRGGTNRQVWMKPPEIAERLINGGRSHNGAGVWMFQPVRPWDEIFNDRDSGLLAGAFDADGCLSKGQVHKRWPIAEFAQYDNPLLGEVKLALESKGFIYKERTKPVRNGKRDEIHNLELAGRDETLRFLGQVRPARLLQWWMDRVDVNALTFTRKSTSGLKRIVACEPDGVAEICALTSSSATYITEYGPAHNTPAFGILRKCNSWASGVVPHFDDVYMGHFHTPMTLTMANGNQIYVSGSPESDNQYAAEFVAAQGRPSQRLHYVDPEAGRVTASYLVWLDEQ